MPTKEVRGSPARNKPLCWDAWQFKRRPNKSIWIIWNELGTYTHECRAHIHNGTVDESSDTPIENVKPNCEALYNYSFFVVVRTPYMLWMLIEPMSRLCVEFKMKREKKMYLHDLGTILLLITHYARSSKCIDLHFVVDEREYAECVRSHTI